MKRALVSLVAGLLLTGTPAEAHVKRYKTQIGVFATSVAVTGNVQASRSECFATRTVSFSQSGVDKGSTVTEADGDYFHNASFTIGVPVTASVEKLVFKKSARHKHLCKPASNSYSPTT